MPLCAISAPSGAMIELSPVVEAYTTRAVALDGPDPGHRRLLLGLAELPVDLEVRVVGLHREQVGPGRDLGPHQVVEAHLVADHVAQPDLPDVEHDGLCPGVKFTGCSEGSELKLEMMPRNGMYSPNGTSWRLT